MHVSIRAIGSFPKLEIDDNRGKDIIDAYKKLQIIGSLEYSFELLISNYYEIEEELLKLSLNESIRKKVDINDYYLDNLLINRRMCNFLSSARLYIDHLDKNSKKFSLEYQSLSRKYKNEKYDSFFSYRLFEALRNHIQHKSIPIGLRSISRLIKIGDASQFIFGTIITLDKDELINDDDFKKSIQIELKEMKNIDLSSLLKEYFEALFDIQERIRVDLFKEYSRLCEIINRVIDDYSMIFPVMRENKQKILGIYNNESISLFSTNIINLIDELVKRNMISKNISKRIVVNMDEILMDELQ